MDNYWIKNSILLITLFSGNFLALGQNTPPSITEQRGSYYLQYQLNVNPATWYEITTSQTFTAYSIEVHPSQLLETSIAEIENESFRTTLDEHTTSNRALSNVISLLNPTSSMRFHSGEIEGEVIIHLLNSDAYFKASPQKRTYKENDPCEEPTSINQAEWRSGLTSPSYSRSFTDVEHIIIHHSAGSNANSNYVQVVRDIYLYHTEVNGWSDIGYNYLIAQDGTIFKGRDPDGGAQDNVRGAHYCGKNSGTMGICLLGNYESDIVPTDEALSSLAKLTSWKLGKESLDPFAASSHQGQNLGVVAGHRDGCSTACPGRNTYDQLNTIKQSIVDMTEDCNEKDDPVVASVYPNPVDIGELLNLSVDENQSIASLRMTDISGRLVASHIIPEETNSIRMTTFQYPPGVYLLYITTADEEVYQSRVVIY